MSFFKKRPTVQIDDTLIRELLTRGVERVFPSPEFLESRLRSGERLSLYLGIDPTGPTLHLGHIIPLLKLRQFQQLGHEIVLLIGDFTATIGDPTDKLAPRGALTREQVFKNAEEYKTQSSKIISFGKSNPAVLRRNSEWLDSLSPSEMFALLSNLTYAQIIKRDMFQERLKEGKDINANELLYPALQGYDSVAMNVDGEVGGNDQTFNMLMGRDLLKRLKKKEKFVIGMKLLVDPTGKKMGKTEGNMVSFKDSPSDAFGKVMSWPDTMILTGFELSTLTPLNDIEVVRKTLEGGGNPKDAKLQLAEAVVSLMHSKEEAQKARTVFESAFSEGKPEEFIEIRLAGREVAEVLMEAKIVASKSELRRLIGEGAVTKLDTDTKLGEDFLKTAVPGKYRLGKHRFVELK